MNAVKGRFAPSPSGRMHLGNVYCALMSWLMARKSGGSWLLRIEDLDRQRCKKECAELLLDDLRWLGLEADEGARSLGDTNCFQSARDSFYEEAFHLLEARGLVYDCFCRRADILASSAPHESGVKASGAKMEAARSARLGGGRFGAAVYSGRCRNLLAEQRAALLKERLPAKRIRVGGAGQGGKICAGAEGGSGQGGKQSGLASALSFVDGHYGIQSCDLEKDVGDFIIRRADGNFSYQLAAAVDDALMGVTDVVRGRDLIASTFMQLFLYGALGFSPPRFFHLPLMVSADGRRLSKRDRDLDMAFFRANWTPERLIGKILFLCGQIQKEESVSLAEALLIFDAEKIPREDIAVR